MNWLQKICQLLTTIERGYDRGKRLLDSKNSPHTLWDIAKQQEHKWRNRRRMPGQFNQTQQQLCSVCGQTLTAGAFVDIKGIAGRGPNAIVCSKDAQRLGIGNNMPVQQPQ